MRTELKPTTAVLWPENRQYVEVLAARDRRSMSFIINELIEADRKRKAEAMEAQHQDAAA